MYACCIFACLLTLSTQCAGQLTARFYLQKESYAPGEPIFLYFEVANSGQVGENIVQADPYSFCSGYHVRLSSDPSPDSSCAPQGFFGSCLSSYVLLPAHKTRTERLLLNYDHKVSSQGDYEVVAERDLPYADAGTPFLSSSKEELHARDVLHFRVDGSSTSYSASIEELVAQLKSKDRSTRIEAARALAAVAPRSAETVLLGFATSDEFRRFAPLAFHNLNTPRSISAMAELLVKSEPGAYEHLECARYLADLGDSRWFPLLREIALKHAPISNYVSDAARSGGEQAVPLLLQLLQSTDKAFTVVNAVSAFSDTGSRSAVPVLIELLKSPDDAIAQRALAGIEQLTHFQVGDEGYVQHPQGQFSRWALWWASAHSTAQIFSPGECGTLSRLP